MRQGPKPLRRGCLPADKVSLNLEEKSHGPGTQTSPNGLPGSWRSHLGIHGGRCESMVRKVWGSWVYQGWENCKNSQLLPQGQRSPSGMMLLGTTRKEQLREAPPVLTDPNMQAPLGLALPLPILWFVYWSQQISPWAPTLIPAKLLALVIKRVLPKREMIPALILKLWEVREMVFGWGVTYGFPSKVESKTAWSSHAWRSEETCSRKRKDHAWKRSNQKE